MMAAVKAWLRRRRPARGAASASDRMPGICAGDISAVGIIIDLEREARGRNEADL